MSRSLAELKQRQRTLRAEGLCTACGSEVAEGHTLCEEHLRYHRQLKRELRAARRAAGLCLNCGGPRPCSHRPRARKRSDYSGYYAMKAAAGLCRCRGCERPRVEGDRCTEHTPAAMKARQRAAQRAWVERRVEDRLCVQCSWPNPEPERSQRCPDCLLEDTQRKAEQAQTRRIDGLCTCGRRPRGHALCSKCRARGRRLEADRTRRRQAAGICRSCPAPALPGRSFCELHRERKVANSRRWRKVRRGEVFKNVA